MVERIRYAEMLISVEQILYIAGSLNRLAYQLHTVFPLLVSCELPR